jgi:polyvinyl alcohol dehydrogenase (cytochrome)
MKRFPVLISLLFLAVGVAAQPVTQHSAWRKYCSDLTNSGVAESGGAISPETAGLLHLLWSRPLAGPIASSPTVVDDVLYIGDWSGYEYAFDSGSGNMRAAADLGTTFSAACVPDVIGVTSAANISGDTVYVAGGDDSFYALDAQTLEVKWKRSLGDNSIKGGYYGWCSPAVVEERVLQGVASNCDNPFVPGRLVSLDAATGEKTDEAFFIEPVGTDRRILGAGVWTSPAIDLESRDIFVTIGSSDDDEAGLTNSIARLSLDTLKIEEGWKVRTTITDADWGSSPTLFTDLRGRRLVGAGQKDGQYYAFLRDDVSDGPIWRTPLALGGPCPTCGEGILSTAAFDGRRLYVGSGQPFGLNDHGAISALDPTDGSVIWQLPVDGAVIAPISYTNGVVFATAGRHAYALNAENGEVLWRATTPANCVGGIAITDEGIFFGDLSGQLYAYAVAPPAPPHLRAIRAR